MNNRQQALQIHRTTGLPLRLAQERVDQAARARAQATTADVKQAIREIKLAELAATTPPQRVRLRSRARQIQAQQAPGYELGKAQLQAEQERMVAREQARLAIIRIAAARRSPGDPSRMSSSDDAPVFLFRALATSNADTKLVWIQLAQVGSFKGHPQGPFEFNPQVFDTICKNFAREGMPIAIDAEHASEMPPNSGSIPAEGAPAMGWIHALDNRGSAGLWGQVEWLEPARSYIKEGRYKYLSPAVRFKSKDRVTGEQTGPRLSSAAITNQPFLRMQPLVASQSAARFLVPTR